MWNDLILLFYGVLVLVEFVNVKVLEYLLWEGILISYFDFD